MSEMKTCTLCGKTKDESEFVRHKAMKDGLSYWCKECTRQRAKEYRESPAGVYTTIKGRQNFYKNHDNPRYKPVIISKENFIEWYENEPKVCAYCDVPEDQLSDFYDSYNKWSWRLSVDAKDNSVGYTKGNIVLACRRCNSLKSDVFDYDEFREIAQKYLKSKWIKLKEKDE